jgi:RNA polymerase sigma factor (sigma-70 family)
MAIAQLNTFFRRLRTASLRRDGSGMTDAQLLGLFVERQDDVAFEALVRRHGPMVWGVCRRVLSNHRDAEDAFQAVFLVLVRKAPAVRPRALVGNWLYGVACRTARKARAASTKRRLKEKQVSVLPEVETVPTDHWRSLEPLVDQALERLPVSYRAAVVLCDLEGKTHKEAAMQLGWPVGTLSTRLLRARQMLAKRLAGHGPVLSGGSLALLLSATAASAGVPTSLMASTIKAATLIARGHAAAGVVSPTVATLIEGVLNAMFWTKLKITAAVLLTLTTIATGLGVVSYRAVAVPPDSVQAGDSFPGEEVRQGNEQRANPSQDTGRARDVHKAAEVQGRITAISGDGKVLTLESRRRAEEPKETQVKLTDRTRIEFVGVLKDLGKKLRVGDAATVSLQKGSTDTATVVQARREPVAAGKIKAVSADGKTLTLEVPSRTRGEGPTQREIKLTDQTKLVLPRGEDAQKLQADYLASVWLQEGSTDTAAAIEASWPRPDAGGEITAVSADGKVLTLQSKTRTGEVTKTDIKLTGQTKIKVLGAESAKDDKLKVGYGATIWLQEGSPDMAAAVLAVAPRRNPDVTGTITAISADGKVLTVAIRKRGEEPTKADIKLTEKTRIEFGGVLKDLRKKMKAGDAVTVWLREGSHDTAGVVQAHAEPDVAGKITAVSADGKSLTLEVPSRNRGEGPTQREIKLTDKTKLAFARGEEGPKPRVGYLAAVWLQEGSTDTAAALQTSRPRPEVSGEITAISVDGKVLTVQSKSRTGEVTTSRIKLSDQTKIEFVGAQTEQEKRLTVGYSAAVWLQAGSKDTASVVQAIMPRARQR